MKTKGVIIKDLTTAFLNVDELASEIDEESCSILEEYKRMEAIPEFYSFELE